MAERKANVERLVVGTGGASLRTSQSRVRREVTWEEARDPGHPRGGTWHGNPAQKGYSQETNVMGCIWLPRDNGLQRAEVKKGYQLGCSCSSSVGWGRAQGWRQRKSKGGGVHEAYSWVQCVEQAVTCRFCLGAWTVGVMPTGEANGGGSRFGGS